MRNAIILHGICDSEEYFSDVYPSMSNSHWIPWLQKQFLIKGYSCQTPDVVNVYEANYQGWLETVSVHEINEKTILVAHSAGCGFFLKYLSENKNINFDKLILVAPFKDPFLKYGDFLQTDFDLKLDKRCNEIHVLYSLDEDVKGIKESVDWLIETYKTAQYHEFENHGHFCYGDMKTQEFQKLLDIALN
jgi:hypothetical protein